MVTTTTTAEPLFAEHLQEQIRGLKRQKCLDLNATESMMVATSSGNGSCLRVWDSIHCWDPATAGQTLTIPCPSYILGFNPQRNASKQCTAESTWFSKDGKALWTNYSSCSTGTDATVIYNVPTSDSIESYRKYVSALRIIADVGYSVSLMSLLVAFVILISFKRLRCPRNVLHLHLFASFIMRAIMSLLKDTVFVEGLSIASDILEKDNEKYFYSQGNWACKMIVSMWQYFIMANYSWILMEGLYLHNLIFQALFTDSSSITSYIVLGWGLPVMFVVPWTVCRATWDNYLCWTTHKNAIIFLLIQGPITASVAINFILFIKISIVLLRKLQASVCEETKTYRRWAKSTLVLLPLFGVHYMVLLGFQYTTNDTMLVVWLFCDQLFTSFNGFFVALLYCFLNGEVRSELGRKWSRFSIEDVLERSNCLGPNSIFSCGRFSENRRHYRPRGSCYSSTSCTVDSVVHSCTADKKRHHTTLKGTAQDPHITKEGKKSPIATSREDLADVGDGQGSQLENVGGAQVKDMLSNNGKSRRWTTKDCDLENNAVELKSMTSPNDIVKL